MSPTDPAATGPAPAGPGDPRASPREVHLWRIPLDRPEEAVAGLGRVLDPEEARRAGRFRLERHRRRFVVGRGALRVILSRYLDAPPSRLAFRYGDFGKPALAGPEGAPPLQFNLAHSHELGLLAVTLDRRVGVDLERVRPMDRIDRLVGRRFSALERAAFAALPAAERLGAFFRAWTRKEAYLKATGLGLSFPLDRFDVSLGPSEPARLIRVDGRPEEAARWSLHDLAPGPDYLGALAVEGTGWRLRRLDFDAVP